MKAWLGRVVEATRTGFWFVPLVMLVLATALALAVLHVDRTADPGTKAALDWAYGGGPEGARSLLSTIAGSMITAASVTFSLASVALSIASQQYGSRVLRNFMRDRITQVLLGTFVSTFIYSVLVVRTIRGSEISGGFVPAVSVTVAIALSLASLVLLVFFIHHISASIQATRIVSVIADSMNDAWDELYPTNGERDVDLDTSASVRDRASAIAILAGKSGYVQTVGIDSLVAIATKNDLVVELTVKPGDHILDDATIARVSRRLEDDVVAVVRDELYVGRERTPTQDIRFQFQQLTDVVIRALSPGINDPFTATSGISQITIGLIKMAVICPRTRRVRDSAGVVRVIAPVASVADVLEETVGHIVVYAASDRFVMAALRRVLDAVEARIQPGSTAEEETIRRLRADFARREA